MSDERKGNDGKPPYRVPPMEEIGAVPDNGLTLVSTFSGCGGSCLGFRMAGFRTLWASEFVPAAREVYELNHPGVPMDARDIRDVRPEEILEAVGKEKGEVDVLEGSPPCASFSTAGKREKKWGEVVKYSETRQRVDDLFFEFARILEGVQPRTFVAENVSGLVKGKAKGYFKEILAALRGCGYEVSARLLDAQWLGVPQARQRLIFVGVREDLGAAPVHPAPLAYRYSVREALPWVFRQRHGRGFGEEEWIGADEAPAQTVGTQQSSGNNFRNGMHRIEAVRVVEDTCGSWPVVDCTDRPAPCVRQAGTGQLYVEAEADISCFAIGREWDKLEPGEQSKKYFSLQRAHPDEPSPCVTQQAGATRSLAGVAHPTERRKFSIAELKRICAFPDDFVLTGSYSQQWERLGRAVPPVMMFHVARVLRDEVLLRLDGGEPWPHDLPCLVAGLGWRPGG